jgi:hypothetical protein
MYITSSKKTILKEVRSLFNNGFSKKQAYKQLKSENKYNVNSIVEVINVIIYPDDFKKIFWYLIFLTITIPVHSFILFLQTQKFVLPIISSLLIAQIWRKRCVNFFWLLYAVFTVSLSIKCYNTSCSNFYDSILLFLTILNLFLTLYIEKKTCKTLKKQKTVYTSPEGVKKIKINYE